MLSRAVQCCCALCCLRGAVLFLLAPSIAVACCALSSGVMPCCGVRCHLVGRFAVLPCAVCAVLCVFCRCVVVCAVFCCCPCAAGALWCRAVCAVTSLHFQKQKKKRLPIFKNRKTVSRWCLALCTLSSLHETIPHTEKTSLLYLFNSWTWAGVHHRSCSCLRPCTCSERGGKRDLDGVVAGGGGTWGIRKRGKRWGLQGRKVLENARDVVFFDYSARPATRGTSLISYIYDGAYGVNYSRI